MPDEEYYLISRSDMEDVADTIREAGGTSAGLEWKAGWKTAITALSGGGGGGGGGTYQAKTNIDPSTSSQTITADSGYDALSSVQINAMPSGTAGTPTATKGTVSNHSISVTPSVTNTTGYITGSTKTGTAVTVSASELVSGSETKTANGTYDVTNLASLVVNVSGGASNVVMGTFTGTTTGTAMEITLNYTGSGYPVAVVIYPSEGVYNSGGTLYGTIARYAAVGFMALKDTSSAPSYSSSADDKAWVSERHKNSTSSSGSTSTAGAVNTLLFSTSNANGSSGDGIVKIKSSTKMSIMIKGSNYGFLSNIEYKYLVLYSS